MKLGSNTCKSLPESSVTFNNINHRGDHDGVGNACVRLSEANELISNWVVDVYHQTRHLITRNTPEYLYKEVLTSTRPRLPEAGKPSNWQELDPIDSEDLRMMRLTYI